MKVPSVQEMREKRELYEQIFGYEKCTGMYRIFYASEIINPLSADGKDICHLGFFSEFHKNVNLCHDKN